MEGFHGPRFIIINNYDRIIVSDKDNHCINILNPDGSVIHKIGSFGTGKGQLHQPMGVATDGENILVADSENKRIQVFKNDGTFISVIESSEDPLKRPCGLAVTTDGYVYVSDVSDCCIKKYKYRDMPT